MNENPHTVKMNLGKVQTINLTNKRGGKSSDSYLRLMVVDDQGRFNTLIMTKTTSKDDE